MAQISIPLDSKRFAAGLTWKDYLAQMGETRARTEENYAKASLTEEERSFFNAQKQVRHVMMLAENWCGDVHRNSPMVARICEAMPNAELRVFFRDQNLDLTDKYLNNGYRSIPVVAFYDEQWNELGRWIERPGAATAKMAVIRANTLEKAPADQQDAAMQEFRKQVNALYADSRGGFWREVAKEIRLILDPTQRK